MSLVPPTRSIFSMKTSFRIYQATQTRKLPQKQLTTKLKARKQITGLRRSVRRRVVARLSKSETSDGWRHMFSAPPFFLLNSQKYLSRVIQSLFFLCGRDLFVLCCNVSCICFLAYLSLMYFEHV